MQISAFWWQDVVNSSSPTDPPTPAPSGIPALVAEPVNVSAVVEFGSSWWTTIWVTNMYEVETNITAVPAIAAGPAAVPVANTSANTQALRVQDATRKGLQVRPINQRTIPPGTSFHRSRGSYLALHCLNGVAGSLLQAHSCRAQADPAPAQRGVCFR